MRSPANKKNKNMESDASATSSVVRRERFLPKMAMRILLVEADDSTRHIIAALLRKCGYKVAAVSDGLKAWELLKGSPHNIDLILTEVDLPSISGYALLTLIMEHEICKHIPIIMMSSRDSVNTVYRCMLRGAADFLVKPIRKNELRNLWQHVWRRHALGGGAQGPLHECVVQQNACSSHSSGHKAGIQRSPECFEISSDAQSSCSKPDMDNEGDDIEDISRSTQSNWDTSLPNDEDLRKEELCHEATIRLTMSNEAGAPRMDASRRTNTEITSVRGCVRNSGLTSDDHHAPLIKQAIDLIGAFDSHLKCDYMSGPISTRNNEDYSPLLALSLTRSHPTGTVNQYTNEKLRPIQSGQSISPKTFNQKDFETDSDKQLSNHGSDNSFATRGPWTTPYNHVPSSCAKPGAAEIGLYSPQQRLLPLPVAVEGIRFELLRSAYSSSVTPGESSYHLNPFLLLNCETRTSQQLHCLTDQNNSHATTHNESENGHKSESTIDFQHFVSVSGTHQSTKSSSPNDAHLHTSCGTNGNNLVPKVKVKTPAEGREEAISLAHDMKSQREAAVTKFRLKRKDRCFDKKVRRFQHQLSQGGFTFVPLINPQLQNKSIAESGKQLSKNIQTGI